MPFLESWSSWSEWSHCDSNGAQMRVRHCDVLFPTGNQCSGNNSENRPCSPDSNLIPGDLSRTHTHTHLWNVLATHAWLHTQLWAHTHSFSITDHHMPSAVIQFISMNPVIMKYVSDPSQGLVSRLEVGFSSRAAFLSQVGKVSLAQGLPSAAGDYMGAWTLVLHLRAVSLLIPTTLLLY